MRKATQKRKLQEASLNPNDLSSYYVGSEVNPGGWRRQDTDPEKVWTNSDRILPRYIKVPKNCERLERHGTYNTNRFISLKSGDFYPGELIIFDFPPVNNELPITSKKHVKANRIYDIKHRRLQDSTGSKTFKQYEFIREANIGDFIANVEMMVKKRSETAMRDFMIIYAPHDKLLDIIEFLSFDPKFVDNNTTLAGATTIYCTFEMYLELIAKFHPFAIYYYHWKVTQKNDPAVFVTLNGAGTQPQWGAHTRQSRQNLIPPAFDDQGEWTSVEYKRTDSDWNQYDIPVDRFDKALGQLTVGMINENGNISTQFENCLWQTTVEYKVETIKAEVLEKEYMPGYMPFNGLERMDRNEGMTLPLAGQTFAPTHGFTSKAVIMSNRGENYFINTRFLLTEELTATGGPDPPDREPDRHYIQDYNNTTDMTDFNANQNPFKNICGNRRTVMECMRRQLDTALDRTLDQIDVYNENRIIQGNVAQQQAAAVNQYNVLPSLKRGRALTLQADQVSNLPDVEEVLDNVGVLPTGVVSLDRTTVMLEATTLTEETIEVLVMNTIQLTDKSFEIEPRTVEIQSTTNRTRKGEIVCSTVTAKLNKYDFIMVYKGAGTKERPFEALQNVGYLQHNGMEHSELGVMVDPEDKEWKYYIAGAEKAGRTCQHKIIHKIKPGLVEKGDKLQFVFYEYVTAPNVFKGYFMMGEEWPGAFEGEVVQALEQDKSIGNPIGFPVTDHWQGCQNEMLMEIESFLTESELLEQDIGEFTDAPGDLLTGEEQGGVDTGADAYLPGQDEIDNSNLAGVKIFTTSPVYTQNDDGQTLERIEKNGYVNYYFDTQFLKSGVHKEKNTWTYRPAETNRDLNANALSDGFLLDEGNPISAENMQHVTYLPLTGETKEQQFEMLYIGVPTETQEQIVIVRVLKGPGKIVWMEGKGMMAHTKNNGKIYDIFKHEGIRHAGPMSQPKCVLIENKHGYCNFVNLAFSDVILEDRFGTDRFITGGLMVGIHGSVISGLEGDREIKAANRGIFGVLFAALAPLAIDYLLKGVGWGINQAINWIGNKVAGRSALDFDISSRFNHSTIDNVAAITSVMSYRGCCMMFNSFEPTENSKIDTDASVMAGRDESLHKCWLDTTDQPIVPGQWLMKGTEEWFSYVTKPMNKADENEKHSWSKSVPVFVVLQNPYGHSTYVPGIDKEGNITDISGEVVISDQQRELKFYAPDAIRRIAEVSIPVGNTIGTTIQEFNIEGSAGELIDVQGPLFQATSDEPWYGDPHESYVYDVPNVINIKKFLKGAIRHKPIEIPESVGNRWLYSGGQQIKNKDGKELKQQVNAHGTFPPPANMSMMPILNDKRPRELNQMRNWTIEETRTDGKVLTQHINQTYDLRHFEKVNGHENEWMTQDNNGFPTSHHPRHFKEFPYQHSWYQIPHRVILEFNNDKGVKTAVELMPATLCNWLEQVDMYPIGQDPTKPPRPASGQLPSNNVIKSPQQKISLATGNKYWFSDVIIGVMNTSTSVKTDMNFVTMMYLQGLSKFQVKVNENGGNRLCLYVTNPAPQDPMMHGANTKDTRHQHEIIFEGEIGKLTIPIPLSNVDEGICMFGYQDHYPSHGSPEAGFPDGKFAGNANEGKGWTAIMVNI